mmetsp:Transcript_87927/g.247022  ORF Transcript_87927/g.247022 Transcript_87927/m.247022 type:complete len:239 (+) Transcript_87927:1289-2005(+)
MTATQPSELSGSRSTAARAAATASSPSPARRRASARRTKRVRRRVLSPSTSCKPAASSSAASAWRPPVVSSSARARAASARPSDLSITNPAPSSPAAFPVMALSKASPSLARSVAAGKSAVVPLGSDTVASSSPTFTISMPLGPSEATDCTTESQLLTPNDRSSERRRTTTRPVKSTPAPSPPRNAMTSLWTGRATVSPLKASPELAGQIPQVAFMATRRRPQSLRSSRSSPVFRLAL